MKLPTYKSFVSSRNCCVYSPKFLLLVFCSLLIFSLPLIFTLLAASIPHFLTAAMTFSCFSCNEIRLLCLQSLALTLSLLPTWVYTSKIMSKKTRLCCCFFLSKRPDGHAFSCQIKPWVTFGWPYLLIELFYIGVPVLRTNGRSG